MDKKAAVSASKRRVSRREFAQAALVGAATAAILPGSLAAQTEKPSKPTVSPVPPSAPPSKQLSPEDEAEANARTQGIFRKYGSRLSEEQRADIMRQVREGQGGLAEIRAFPLDNAVAPATVLRIATRSPRS